MAASAVPGRQTNFIPQIADRRCKISDVRCQGRRIRACPVGSVRTPASVVQGMACERKMKSLCKDRAFAWYCTFLVQRHYELVYAFEMSFWNQ